MTHKTHRRYQRVMSLAEAQGLPAGLLRRMRAEGVLPPIAGGSVGAPGGETPGGDGPGTSTPTAEPGESESDDDDADDDSADDDDTGDGEGRPAARTRRTRSTRDEDGDSDDFIRMPRSEMQRLRRELREAKKNEVTRATEERSRREKELAEQEKWKDLAASREDRINELEGELEALRMEGTKNERKANIVKVAKRLNFEYPDDAYMYLEVDDMEDEQSIESALKSVLRERPKLKSRRRGSGAPIPDGDENDGKGGGLTIEDVKKMSPQEINARWPEVQAVMRAQGAAAS